MKTKKILNLFIAYWKNTECSANSIKKEQILVAALIIILTNTACTTLRVPETYVIGETSLKDSLKLHEENLVLFWTDWCGGSHYRINELYLPLNEKIKTQELGLKIFLLASDSNISLKQMDELRDKGISTYYIDKPGGFAIANRLAIKKFINSAFPNNQIEKINNFQFGIPVELLISKDLEVINETETNKSYDYIKQILGS